MRKFEKRYYLSKTINANPCILQCKCEYVSLQNFTMKYAKLKMKVYFIAVCLQ